MSDSVPQKHCPRCNRDLPATTEFFCKHSRSKDGLRYFCKSCRHKDYLADLASSPDFNKIASAKQRVAFLAKSPEEQREILAHNAQRNHEARPRKKREGLCISCLSRPCEAGYRACEQCRANQSRSRMNNRESIRLRDKQRNDRLREQVFAAYGGVCAYCSETRPEFLSVDHVNNDGGEHRRAGLRGICLYHWLRRNGFPQDGFQLLCHNCNWSKFSFGRPVSQSDRDAAYAKRWRDVLRQEVLSAYGGKCACCGEVRSDVLTVDHIDGGGGTHRRQVGAGTPFYAWLRKQDFPQEGFQLLCRNCNHAKFSYSVCPHQKEAS